MLICHAGYRCTPWRLQALTYYLFTTFGTTFAKHEYRIPLLKDWVNINESAATVANELSVKGLEVEHLETWKKYNADFDNMVVAQVTKKWKHPDADKLSVTEINTGHETLQIVCGAPNVAEGQKVILAKVGCTI